MAARFEGQSPGPSKKKMLCRPDFMGCYCLKFYNNKGTENFVTEDQVMRDFSKFGVVVDIRGPGLFV